MAEIPFELKKLPPATLDVLRYFAVNGNEPADDLTIMDGADLTERSFSKAIKRLITKHFADMDGMRNYTLTDKGVQLMNELIEYDQATGGAPQKPASSQPAPPKADPIQARLSVVLSEPFIADQPSTVHIGLDQGLSSGQTEVMVRLSAVNGTLDKTDATLAVAQGACYTSFNLTAGTFKQVRLRLEALQADTFSGDLHVAGGMYVDVDVTFNENEAGQLAAFGTDVTVLPL